MTFNVLQEWIKNYFLWLLPIIILLAYLLYRGTRYVLGRAAYAIAFKTESVYDDLFVDRLQPFRFSWLVPLLLIYYQARYFSLQYPVVISITIVLIIWFLVDLLFAILSGINDVYKHNPRYQGVSVAGYIGIVKVLVAVSALVLTISYLFEVEPIALIGGVGAWLAVLLLIFRDTILSFLASIQISSQQMIKEGDEVNVPAYGANGVITSIDLQTINISNYDNTTTTIPTSKIVDVGFKNYRNMLESGVRRIKYAILLDVDTIKFVDETFQTRLGKIDFVEKHLPTPADDVPVPQTNLDHFIQYANGYLQARKEVRHKRFPFVIRILEPTASGIPLEFYFFVKASSFVEFNEMQTEIFVHILAVLSQFELKAAMLEYR